MEGQSLREAYSETKQKYQCKQISRWWLVSWTLFFLVLVEVGAQMFYPGDLARFNTSIDGLNVSRKNSTEIAESLLANYESRKVIIENPAGEQIEFSLLELGASIDVGGQVSSTIDYSLGWRFVPFSLFWPRNIDIYPDTQLGIGTSLAQKEPVNATITVKDDQLILVEAQFGLEVGDQGVDSADICSGELVLRISQQSTMFCDIHILRPVVSTATVETVLARVQSALSGGLTFDYKNERRVQAEFRDAIKWLNFAPNEEKADIDVGVNIDEVRGFLEKTDLATLNQSAENNRVNLVNGVVSSQTAGKAGWGIDYQGAVDTISEIIDGAAGNVVAIELAHIYPGTIYDRKFTDDFIGLAAELEYLYGDKNVAIVTMDLTGRGRNIYINQWKQFTAASTYKLFVGYSMLKSGSPPSCFETMIINSDNDCPRAWLDEKGLKNVENEAHEIGASSVTYFGNLDMRTSAMDLANFLRRIYSQELPIDNNRFISAMKAQRFRQGIPAGLGGNAVVADKVGFLWGLLHDAGIVYSNKGDYIQVILTDGYSWGTIAEIAGKIYGKM
jgi:beta-lactamase class A